MDRYGSRTIACLTASAAAGGLICLGLILLLVASTIVLGLIPLYLPNHGEAGYGEHYRIQAFVLKALYQNTSSGSLNGSVVDSLRLSTLCGTAYQNEGAKEFAGCLAEKFISFDAHNTSTVNRRRRRRSPNAGLYEIGEINLYYSTACPPQSDTPKYASSKGLSNCIKRRLSACNSFRNATSQSAWWTQSSEPFTQTIVANGTNVSQTVIVEQVYGLSILTAGTLAQAFNLSHTTIEEIRSGCQYRGPLPQGDIAAILSSQRTTPQESSTPPSG